MRQVIVTWFAAALLVLSGVGSAAAAPSSAMGSALTTASRSQVPSSASTGLPPATTSLNTLGRRGSAADTHPPDPKNDTIGWVNGYWYNESINVDQSNGLNKTELHAYVSRMMARVEYLRHENFKHNVPVSVISRKAYSKQAQNQSSQVNASYDAWNNQVWKALFISSGNKDVQKQLGQTSGSSVAGFYSPSDNEIKIITSTPNRPVIDNATLAHELTHALQDQHYNLSKPKYSGQTQDGQLAEEGVVEGEANYIEEGYKHHCQTDWQCVATPKSGTDGGGSGQTNLGILLTILQPYSDGPVYVNHIRQQGGWQAFDKRFRHPPNSTEQTIHLTDQQPTPLPFNDTSTDGWKTYPHLGKNGSDTVGEASIYTMFWYNDRQLESQGKSGIKGFDWQQFTNTNSQYDLYNYNSTPSSGWANDRVFPYYKNTSSGTEHGYVWKTAWDSQQDAREFYTYYLRLLRARGATRTESGTYVIGSGGYADSYVVHREGTDVTIVNGPTQKAVEAIRPGLSSSPTSQKTNGSQETTTEVNGSANGNGGSDASGQSATASTTTGTRGSNPGFGTIVALCAIAALAVVALRRR